MPTAVTRSYLHNWLQPSQHPELSLMERFQVAANQTFAKGQVLGILSDGGTLTAYNDAGSGGAEVAKAICPVACTSDGSGVITVEGGNLLGETEDTIPVFIGGYFFTADLTGIDANGLADMQGRLLWGDLTTGEIVIPV